MPHLCAFGCRVKDVPVHVFPNPDKFPERFKTWVSLVGGKLETYSDYEFYKKKRICDIHFIEAHRSRFNRLNALAVPSLHIPKTSKPVNATLDYQVIQPLPVADCSEKSEPVNATLDYQVYQPLPAADCSGKGNCEDDKNECLQTLEFMLKKQQHIVDTPDVSEEKESTFNICIDHQQESDGGQGNYVCGWVLKKCLKKVVKKCQKCRDNLIDFNEQNKNNSYIKRKEYQNKNWLCYPNKDTEACFKDIKNLTAQFLKTDMPKKNCKRFIISHIDDLVEYPFHCNVHKAKLKEEFVNTTLNIIIFSWCRSINRILSGKLCYVGDDDVKMAAQNYYNKHKNYKNRK